MITTLKLILKLKKLRKYLMPTGKYYSIADLERDFLYKDKIYIVRYNPGIDIIQIREIRRNSNGSSFMTVLYQLSPNGFQYKNGIISNNEIEELYDYDDTQFILTYGRDAYVDPDFLKEIEKLNYE